MTNISTASLEELAQLTNDTEDKKILRKIAEQVGVTFSGNTGVDTLKSKILAELILDETLDETPDENQDEGEDEVTTESNDPVMAALVQHREDSKDEDGDGDGDDDLYAQPEKGVKKTSKYSVEEMLEMDAARIKDPTLRRNVIRTQAMRLIRVKINNLDPNDAEVPGALITCYSKYTGKVSKYVPFDEDQHPNGYHVPKIILDDLKTRTYNLRKEIKKPGSSFGVKEYKTVVVKKFAIEELTPLTEKELKALASQQAAAGAIDRN